MIKIERNNIFDLIGSSQTLYDSCIITTFSFEPVFFNSYFKGRLRKCGINNIIVLVDSYIYDKVAEDKEQSKKIINNGYSLVRINKDEGYFHPKMIFITGKNSGLLFIGSGNMSFNGMSLNEEVWSAFSLKGENSNNSPIFHKAWEYLKNVIDRNNMPLVKLQTEWILENSSWLAAITEKEYITDKNGDNIYFLTNDENTSILEKTHNIINREISEITLVAPYFDNNGEALKNIQKTFNPRTLNCIVDKDYGNLPINLDMSQIPGICFANWTDCFDDENKKQRLHCKIYQIQCADNTTFLLFGSANASVSGLGSLEQPALNDECCILLHSAYKKNYLQDLGFNLSQLKQNQLTSLKNQLNQPSVFSKIEKQHKKIKLLYSEITDFLIVYINKVYNKSCEICLYDDNNNFLRSHQFPVGLTETKIKIENEKGGNVGRIVVRDDSGEIISNYIFPLIEENVIKSNPDKINSGLVNIISGEYNDENLSDLLKYVDYHLWNTQPVQANTYNAFKVKNQTPATAIYQQPAEEIYSDKFDNVVLSSDKYSILKRTNVKIADFLRKAGKNFNLNQYLDDEDDNIDENLDINNESENAPEVKKDRNIEKKDKKQQERKVIFNFINKYLKTCSQQLKCLYNDKQKQSENLPQIKTDIDDFSVIMIIVQLLYRRCDNNDNKDFFKHYNLFNRESEIKKYILEATGKFLLISRSEKAEVSDYRQKKINEYREDIFHKSIWIISGLKWERSEWYYVTIILLNMFEAFSDLIPEDFNEKLYPQLNELEEIKPAQKKWVIKENVAKILGIYDKYKHWDKENAKTEISKYSPKIIIYRKATGFSWIYDYQKNGNLFKYNIYHPGFDLCPDHESYKSEYEGPGFVKKFDNLDNEAYILNFKCG